MAKATPSCPDYFLFCFCLITPQPSTPHPHGHILLGNAFETVCDPDHDPDLLTKIIDV